MNNIYAITIFPIELIYKYIYLSLVYLTNNLGLALLVLSLLNYFLLIPLNKLVRGLQESENNIQDIITPQLKNIRETSHNEQRHNRIQKLYERYSYHPIFAIRSVFPLLVQLPFLMAVYFMLSALRDLDGVSFLFLPNLAQPDGILFGINLMPFVMTIVSLVNACFVVKLSTPQRKQATIVALLFFVLLYNAPSALLLYWTMNNVLIIAFSLLSKASVIERVRLHATVFKQRLIPSVLDSSGLLLGLSIIVPLFFTISLNTNFFTIKQLINFTIFIPIVLCTSLAIGLVLDKVIKASSFYKASISFPCKLSINKNATKSGAGYQVSFSDFFYILIALTTVYLNTVICLNIKVYIADFVLANLVRVAIILAIFFTLRRLHFKALNLSMISLFLFCCIQFSLSQTKNIQAEEASKGVIHQAFHSFPIDEKLQNKPNIYLLYLESYMSPSTLKHSYNFDNSVFENALVEKGFKIYDNVYSHAPFTKGSLLSLLMMNHNVTSLFAGYQDITDTGHRIIGGSQNNLLFKYLKMNNYKISSYYDSQYYYFKRHGELLDHMAGDIDESLLSLIRETAPSLNHRIKLIQEKILKQTIFPPAIDVYPKAIEHLHAGNDSNQPSFIILKPLNELHVVPAHGAFYNNYPKWTSASIYQNGVSKMNQELLSFIKQVEKYDPNGLIILIGDHGHKYSATTGDKSVFSMTPQEFKSKFPHLKMTSQEFVEDMFSVFLAVKMPAGAKAELAIDSKFAYADLFRYIFSALDDNPIFLKHKSENISINSNFVTVRRDDVISEKGEKPN